jgi:hypothetical protein
MVFDGGFRDAPHDIRQSIVLNLGEQSPPHYMLDRYCPVLDILLDDPNGGIRQLVTETIVGELVEHGERYESALLDTLTTIVTDDDRGVQRHGVGLVGNAIDSLGSPAACRDLLVDVATDETNHQDVQTDALELLADSADRFDSHGPLVSALETASTAEADPVRRDAVLRAAQVLTEVGTEGDRTDTLRTIIRRGLLDEVGTVRDAAATVIAALSPDDRPDLTSAVGRLREVLATRDLPPTVRVDIADVVSQYDTPIQPLSEHTTDVEVPSPDR